ncbi:hypothetical protein ElyMa_005194400 [Elysia marginata]|uniref:Uncharacterized protein n=1 Tax=Elysia marginata TaxID=1093978 RepID=A0AAV4JSV5_9GAST|nr:hypothetical protein ElyMa_005194400 [Elysia marginata]
MPPGIRCFHPDTLHAIPIHGMPTRYMACYSDTWYAIPIHGMPTRYMACRPETGFNLVVVIRKRRLHYAGHLKRMKPEYLAGSRDAHCSIQYTYGSYSCPVLAVPLSTGVTLLLNVR